jgi:hypothetical protein
MRAAPGLISVRDPAVQPVGDVMVDGVFPLADAVRPLGLSGPATWSRWRLEHAGSRPRGIGVCEGCARTGCSQTAGARASSPSSRSVW